MNTLGSFYKMEDEESDEEQPQNISVQNQLQPINENFDEDHISRKGSQYPDNLSRKGSQFPPGTEKIDVDHINDNRKPSYFDKKDKDLASEAKLKWQDYPLKATKLLLTSSSSITTYLGIGILNLVQMVIIKQTGVTNDIASFGLGLTWINACSYAIIMALNDGIRSISSQIYGAKKLKILGAVYNQSIAMSWTVFAFVLVLIFNTEFILTHLGIEPVIAKKSQTFTIYGIPSLIGSIYFETSRQFLFAQKIFKVHMYAQSLAAVLHGIWCYLLIIHFGWGIEGAGIARSITFILSYVFVWIQMKWKHYGEDALVPFNLKQAFHVQAWWQILKVAIPAGGTNYLKWCSIECLTILVGNLPNKNSLAGHAAFFSMNIFFSMFAKGIQTTINSYVGNAIGEGREQLALNLTQLSIFATFLLCTILLLIGIVIEDYMVDLLTTSTEMATQFLIAYRMYLRVDIWGNFLQQVQAGILSAMNRQNDTVKYYMFTFIFQQFVVAIFFGFYLDWGLAGVWLGRVSAGVVNSICFMVILCRINIKQEIQSVKERIEKTKEYHNQTLKAIEEQEEME